MDHGRHRGLHQIHACGQRLRRQRHRGNEARRSGARDMLTQLVQPPPQIKAEHRANRAARKDGHTSNVGNIGPHNAFVAMRDDMSADIGTRQRCLVVPYQSGFEIGRQPPIEIIIERSREMLVRMPESILDCHRRRILIQHRDFGTVPFGAGSQSKEPNHAKS